MLKKIDAKSENACHSGLNIFTGDPVTFARAYEDMIKNTMVTSNSTNGITPEQYCQGWTVFDVMFTPTLENCEGFELITNTNTTVSIKFNEPIPQPGVEIVFIAEFDQLLSIDHTRNVTSDGMVG